MMQSLLLLFLCLLLSISGSRSALSRHFDRSGQTIAPVGSDYLHYMYAQRKDVTSHMRAPHASTVYNRRPAAHTLAFQSPFYTLRDYSCADSDAHGAFVKLSAISGQPDGAVVRHVSSAQLSTIFDRAAEPILGGKENTIVLFHGGQHCEWSRTIWKAWVEATRQFDGLCLVAINGANDPMLNNNLMVFGFPTVMRIRSEMASETFRGNRTGAALVQWIVRITGIAPVTGITSLQEDVERFGVNERSLEQFDVSGTQVEPAIDWPLLGANIVSVGIAVWTLLQVAKVCGQRRKDEQH